MFKTGLQFNRDDGAKFTTRGGMQGAAASDLERLYGKLLFEGMADTRNLTAYRAAQAAYDKARKEYELAFGVQFVPSSNYGSYIP
jgi:hypothetical protein